MFRKATWRDDLLERLVGFRTALVVVDMQQGFLNEHTAQLPARIVELIETNVFGYVLFTAFYNGRNSPHRVIRKWMRFTGSRETPIVEPLRAYAKQTIVKQRYSCFCPEFLRWLGTHEWVDTLCFAGVDTDVCVLKSAVDAFEEGYLPFVFTDCCASHGGPEAHERGLGVLRRMIGDNQVVASGDVIRRLRSPRAKPGQSRALQVLAARSDGDPPAPPPEPPVAARGPAQP